jgi:predicted nuclease of predicted toxin-antitoxin system
MRLLVDENCWAALVSGLRESRHDVISAVESCRGASDMEIGRFSARELRAIVTQDRGFGQMLLTSPDPAYAVILLRLQRLPPGSRVAAALSAINKLPPLKAGQIAVITPSLTRIGPASG